MRPPARPRPRAAPVTPACHAVPLPFPCPVPRPVSLCHSIHPFLYSQAPRANAPSYPNENGNMNRREPRIATPSSQLGTFEAQYRTSISYISVRSLALCQNYSCWSITDQRISKFKASTPSVWSCTRSRWQGSPRAKAAMYLSPPPSDRNEMFHQTTLVRRPSSNNAHMQIDGDDDVGGRDIHGSPARSPDCVH